MSARPAVSGWRAARVAAAAALLGGCTGLRAPEAISPNHYLLDTPPAVAPAAVRRPLVLAVAPLRAQPGFDGTAIVYRQRPHELGHFATARWVAPPARLLEPLLVQALGRSQGFRAVVPAAGTVPAELLLEVELIRLQHDFLESPSRVQLVLAAQLTDLRGRRVLAARVFEAGEDAGRDDPYGGVVAANRLAARVLGELVAFCVEAAAAP